MKKILSIHLVILLVLTPFAFDMTKAEATTCGFGTDIGGGQCRGYITDTSATSWSVPNDWSSINTIEVIGGGGQGGYSEGGGGGAYSKITNATLTAGVSVGIQVGEGGNEGDADGESGEDTYLCNSTSNCASIGGSAVIVGAKGGERVAGGLAASGVGTVKYSGGSGGSQNTGASGGSGGAAGPNGDGGDGGNAGGQYSPGGGGGNGGGSDGSAGPGGTAGGSGGNNYLGSGGGAGGSFASPGSNGTNGGGGGAGGYAGGGSGNGGAGTEWDGSHGSGGGGGGLQESTGQAGAGGLYGGGGTGTNYAGTAGNGAQGIIVITYTSSGRATLSRPANNLGLIGYYPLNEGTSTTAGDFSSVRRIGNLTNSPTWVNGKNGKALTFDGTNYVHLASGNAVSIPSGGAITVTAWVKTSDDFGLIVSLRDSNDAPVIDLGVGHNGVTTNAGHFLPLMRYDSGSGLTDINSTVRIDDGRWHHVAAVLDQSADTFVGYVDGVVYSINQTLDGSLTLNDYMAIGAEKLWIDLNTGVVDNRYLEGTIDEVRIYNRALSAAEIRSLGQPKAAITGGGETLKVKGNLIGHWTFNGKDTTWSSASAGTTYDVSGNNNHGTLNGFNQLTSPVQGKIGQGLNFDASGMYVSAANESNFDFDSTSPFSFSAWVRHVSANSAYYIIAKQANGGNFPGYSFNIDAINSQLRFNIVGSDGSTIVNNTGMNTLFAGDWHHLVVTVDGSGTGAGTRSYIDGAFVTTGSGTLTASPLTDATLTIGRNLTDGGGLMNGVVDDVRIYNKKLSDAEVKLLYKIGAGTVIRNN